MMIREMAREDAPQIELFLLSLNQQDRQRRFCGEMSDDDVRLYVSRMDWQSAKILGAFNADGRLMGVLELHDCGQASELALAVSTACRRRGVGHALMNRALVAAKAQGKERVTLTCLANNEPMVRLAHSAGLSPSTNRAVTDDAFGYGQDAVARITFVGALYARSWAELVERLMTSGLRFTSPLATSPR